MKLVINKCFGGFGLSTAAVKELIAMDSELITKTTYSKYTGNDHSSFHEEQEWRKKYWKPVGGGFYTADFEHVLYDETGKIVWMDNVSYEKRNHPDLVAVVEKLGKAASGQLAELKIVEIPDGINWEISDYDGIETVEEEHRSW